MQRTILILACFFVCANSFAQQYPFVHYTPKDGLISNLIKNIFQDSKGRLYFTSVNGLSVYDGSRFINYTSKNGLAFDIVNSVLEVGDDSIWIASNSPNINCLVKGKMSLLSFYNHDFIINNLCKDDRGRLYAASEQGLLIFNNKDRFLKLPFIDSKGDDVSRHLAHLFSVGNYLFVLRDYSMLPNPDQILYVYNKITGKIIAEVPGVYNFHAAADGRLWLSTENKILAIDTVEFKKEKVVLQELHLKFAQIRNKGKYFVSFDKENNCWLGDQNSMVIKAAANGTITTFTQSSGLNMFHINDILQDREGITWIATNNAGVSKLVHSNFSYIEKPFDVVNPSDISFDRYNNNLLIYSSSASSATIIHDNGIRNFRIKNLANIKSLIETPFGFFGVRLNGIYKLEQKDNTLYGESKPMVSDLADNVYAMPVVDKNGNLIICGKYNVNAIVRGDVVVKKKLPFFADFSATDGKGNVWIATRANDLIMYKTNPEQPSNYLEQKFDFKKELSGISPRSMTIDTMDNIWIGTRSHGIHIFSFNNGKLIKKHILTSSSGLSDDFITQLTGDKENNIWACSGLGLDKITIKNGVPVIENITRQNNIYQSVFKVEIDKNNTAWGLVSNGLIKITPEIKKAPDYFPTLVVSLVKSGKDTVNNDQALSHFQNDLSFSFAATSFYNEKQVMYSYRLQSGSNNQWSEPSNNAIVSFIDLPPGDYTLDIKANFPAGRYPEQIIHYKFSITPAWWQTWWFRSIAVLVLIGILIIGFRYYYRRKLEKQKHILEKQQAIEKERTRIATDMHDDLGAGLSRIKFLSENVKANKGNSDVILNDIEKISAYSDEMAAKMGEIVWALNQKNDTVADLVAFTRSYVLEYLSGQHISCELNTPLELPSAFITGEMRQHIFLSVKECLHNIVKHAGATKVYFSIKLNGEIEIIIHDNGKGINLSTMRPFSNGIQNIEKRINEIRGKVTFLNEAGTKVIMNIPHEV